MAINMRRAALALSVGSMLATSAHADGFMKLGDLTGDSKDRGHPGWITIKSVGESVSNSMSAVGGGAGAGKTQFGDIVVVKQIDGTSAKLRELVTKGMVVPSAEIEFVRPGEQPFAFYKLTLTKVFVTSVDASAADSAGTETVKLSFQTIRWTTPSQDAKGAIVKNEASWNRAQNTP